MPPGTSASATASMQFHGSSMSRMTRSTWPSSCGQALLEVAEAQVPRGVRLALGGVEELVDVALGDLGELLAQLEGRDLAPRADRAQQRAGQRTGARAGLDDAGAGEDVGQRDDLGGVLGVDHGRAARHRDHELVEQRAEHEVLPAGGRGHGEALVAADHARRGRGGPCWRRSACPATSSKLCLRPFWSTRRTHSPSRRGPRWTPDQASAGTSARSTVGGSDMAGRLVRRSPIHPSGEARGDRAGLVSGTRCRGTPGRRRR